MWHIKSSCLYYTLKLMCDVRRIRKLNHLQTMDLNANFCIHHESFKCIFGLRGFNNKKYAKCEKQMQQKYS